jgi:hypothetical protein
MTPARVIEDVTVERRTPVLEDPHELAAGVVALRDQVGAAVAFGRDRPAALLEDAIAIGTAFAVVLASR